MKIVKIIAILAVSILILSACKNGNAEQSQSDDYPVIAFPQSHSYDTTITKHPSDTIDIKQQPETNHATVKSHGSSNRSSYYKSKKEVNRHGYAERKKTDELEEEYCDVFGKDYLYHIDDEEYEAGEDEYDYDE